MVFILCVFVTETAEITYLISYLGKYGQLFVDLAAWETGRGFFAQNISEIMARKYFTMAIIYSLDISGDSWDIS